MAVCIRYSMGVTVSESMGGPVKLIRYHITAACFHQVSNSYISISLKVSNSSKVNQWLLYSPKKSVFNHNICTKGYKILWFKAGSGYNMLSHEMSANGKV